MRVLPRVLNQQTPKSELSIPLKSEEPTRDEALDEAGREELELDEPVSKNPELNESEPNE